MPFPAKYLNQDEEVVLDLRPHWWYMFGAIVSVVVSLAVTVGVLLYVQEQRHAFVVGALVMVSLTTSFLSGRWAVWTTTNLVITTDRLIHRSGVFAKQGREIPLTRINDISFTQTVLERVLGCGDLMIESAGERGQQQFNTFPQPEFVQNQIHRQIELAQTRVGGGGGGPRSPGNEVVGRGERPVLDRLSDLEALRQRGVVSEGDFEVRKARLLDQL